MSSRPETPGNRYVCVTAGEADDLVREHRGEDQCDVVLQECAVDPDVLVTLHPGACRNHHRPTFERFGPDTGHDIPIRIEFTEALRPLLEHFGTYPGFHLVVFTLDETVWSRELAPLAGCHPSVYLGVPWWFLDASQARRRFRAAVTETAGFSRTSGFADDTRAFCSIPARHDLSRIDAGYLAELVAEHQLGEDEALASRVVRDMAEMVDPRLASLLAEHVSTVTTTVNRIIPRTDPPDLQLVARATGRQDQEPVTTEPFAEWVLSESFLSERPRWEDAGATVTDGITPYEHRKLWPLNGSHSLLASAGSIRGHMTVAEAVPDDTCRNWVQRWWALDPAAGANDELVAAVVDDADRFEHQAVP